MNGNKKIAVLVSGGGTNLQALIDASKNNDLGNGDLSLVVSSNPNAYALTRAKENNIKTEVLNWRDYKDLENVKKTYGERLVAFLKENEIDLVICAGFMIILDNCVCQAYPNKMLNVHPSLIPAFSGEGYYGLKVHEAALKRGVKLTGATVHFVNEICDGGKIILQKSVQVLDGDTPEVLQKRVMEVERELLPKAVKMFCNNEI